jgi:hypothetical protein
MESTKTRPKYRLIQRHEKLLQSISADIADHDEQPLILRVKRERAEEPLEELQLQFGLDGSFKRKKLVTQTEALVGRFN